MTRRLIYQVAVGPERSLYESCIASVSRYCQRYGITHHVQREPILKIVPQDSHRSEGALRLGYLPIFEKENAFEYLSSYDAVCVIDSDIYIRDHAPCIFDAIEDVAFAGVLERDIPAIPRHVSKLKKYSQAQYGSLKDTATFDWNHSGADFYNMGLMMLRPSLKKFIGERSVREFLGREDFQRFINGEGAWKWSTDQTLLNYWIKHDGIPAQNLDWRYNALYGAVRTDRMHEAWFVHFFLAEHNVAGRSAEEIIQELDACKPE